MENNNIKTCYYLLDYAKNKKYSKDGYFARKTELDYLIERRKNLKDMFNNGFSFLNNYSSMEQMKQIKDSPDFEILSDIISTVLDNPESYTPTLLRNIFLLHSVYNEELDSYELDDEEPQYIYAFKEFKKIDTLFTDIIKQFSNDLDEIKKSNDFKLVELIERIIKSDENGITINGNITQEELDEMISILDNSDLDTKDKTAFLASLIPEMVKYKKKKEVLDAKINTDKLNNSLNSLTHRKELISLPIKKRNAVYDYDRINKSIEILQKLYDGNVEEAKIDENTPFDKDRVRLYFSFDKGIDYNLVLYDLKHFINPERVQKLWEEDKISPKELDAIRNIVYKWIISKTKLIGLETQSEYLEQEEIDKKDEVIQESNIVIPTHNTSIETLQEADKLYAKGNNVLLEEIEDDEYVNESLQYLTDEEKVKVENALTVANEFIRDFEQKYPSSKISREELSSFLLDGNTYSYDIDLGLIKLYLETIPELKKVYESYESIYEEIRTSKELIGYDDLLYEEHDKLMKLVDDVLSRLELFGEDVKEDKNMAANILLIDQEYPIKKSKVSEDALAIKKTGQYNGEFIEGGLQTLKNRPYTEAIRTDRKFKINNDKFAATYNPHFYRQSNVHYAYIVIYVCDENLKELIERYKLENNDIRLMYIPTLFLQNGFSDGEKSMTSKEDTIEWYKEIFKKPFNEETRRIAFELLDRSLEIEKAIGKEKEYGSSDNQSLN